MHQIRNNRRTLINRIYRGSLTNTILSMTIAIFAFININTEWLRSLNPRYSLFRYSTLLNICVNADSAAYFGYPRQIHCCSVLYTPDCTVDYFNRHTYQTIIYFYFTGLIVLFTAVCMQIALRRIPLPPVVMPALRALHSLLMVITSGSFTGVVLLLQKVLSDYHGTTGIRWIAISSGGTTATYIMICSWLSTLWFVGTNCCMIAERRLCYLHWQSPETPDVSYETVWREVWIQHYKANVAPKQLARCGVREKRERAIIEASWEVPAAAAVEIATKPDEQVKESRQQAIELAEVEVNQPSTSRDVSIINKGIYQTTWV